MKATVIMATDDSELTCQVIALGNEGYRIVTVLISPFNNFYQIVAQRPDEPLSVELTSDGVKTL